MPDLRPLGLALLVLLGLLVLRVTAPARAQDYSQPLLGERDLGMGGAVTASSTGPTAAYYNPAGLLTGGQTAIGASLSLRTFQAYNIDNGFASSAGVEDLDDVGLDTVSVFLGGVLNFGDRSSAGHARHALAAGTLVRSSIGRSFIDTAVTDDRASSFDLDEGRSDRWYYLSYAARPSSNVGLGVTAALSVRGETYLETSSDGRGLTDGPPDPQLTARDVEIDLETIHLVVRGGVSWRITDWLQAGLTLQAPGIPLSSSGRAEFLRVSVEQPESTLYRLQFDTDGSIPSPWEARAGLYARVAPELGVGADFGVIGAYGTAEEPWSVLGEPVPLDRDRPAATYFAGERRADLGFEAALGAEVDAFESFPLRAGLFYERSGRPRFSTPVNAYDLDAIDRVGGAASVGFHDEEYNLHLGVSYVYGSGTGLRPSRDTQGPAYLPTDVTTHQVVVVFSGVTGAAADLALEAYRAMTGTDRAEPTEEELMWALPLPPPEITREELLRRMPLPPRRVALVRLATDPAAPADEDTESTGEGAASDPAAREPAASVEPPPEGASAAALRADG